MKRFILLLVTLFAMTNVMAQLQPDKPIPADKEVRVGRLENGMTYYIRHNEKPKGQASFYIFHHVGAVQEEDSQQGLAHFLEHMAFNGTKHLPGKKMIEYLERNGGKFGADLNAYTSYEETCYNLDNVPTANPATIDTALLILHDWISQVAEFDMGSMGDITGGGNNDPIQMTAFGALLGGEIGAKGVEYGCICLGYASAFNYMVQN